jgi:hypothetical protein
LTEETTDMQRRRATLGLWVVEAVGLLSDEGVNKVYAAAFAGGPETIAGLLLGFGAGVKPAAVMPITPSGAGSVPSPDATPLKIAQEGPPEPGARCDTVAGGSVGRHFRHPV